MSSKEEGKNVCGSGVKSIFPNIPFPAFPNNFGFGKSLVLV
jgi:hypothetical protein